MNVKAKSKDVTILIYDRMWEKELAQRYLDALHHSDYMTDTELFMVDGKEYIAVKVR